VGTTRWCPCTNSLCFALNGLRTSRSAVWFEPGTQARRARLWYDVVPRGREQTMDDVLQDGVLDVTLLQRAAPEANIWDATGRMFARPSANATLDWFRVRALPDTGLSYAVRRVRGDGLAV